MRPTPVLLLGRPLPVKVDPVDVEQSGDPRVVQEYEE
jgi:hypothetical protein